ncbi:hypothetical protein ARMSODRAFT_1027284 [Armillaria solidipes]|uniref:Uncharacterized protein n=1 Tax=Armillaria solidipes TaxID=1076256 RepID=A0A2H3B6W9_9AGAR|nr:hypothetical protein ARMSODRAFT_1027284 [Armillaria solidipes]
MPSPTPPMPPTHSRVLYPPLFWWGNTILLCATAPNALAAGCRHLILIATFSTLYLLLQRGPHLLVLITPVFDVGESIVISCLPMHLDVPASNSLAFNVPRITSIPVLESTNRYAILQVEDTNNDDNDLRPQDDRCDAGDTVAATGRPSRWDLYEMDSRMAPSQDLKSKQPSPLSLGPVWETLKGLSQSPARAQAKAAEPTRHRTESPIDDSTKATSGSRMGIKSGPLTSERTGRTNQPQGLTQVQPDMPLGGGSSTRHPTHSSILIQKKLNEDDEEVVADANQRMRDAPTQCKATTTKTAAGKEAASTQAVNRGHSVTIVEIPNEEDDTAFLL